jgi:branched-chain amino acid transport system substrate-binding protein
MVLATVLGACGSGGGQTVAAPAESAANPAAAPAAGAPAAGAAAPAAADTGTAPAAPAPAAAPQKALAAPGAADAAKPAAGSTKVAADKPAAAGKTAAGSTKAAAGKPAARTSAAVADKPAAGAGAAAGAAPLIAGKPGADNAALAQQLAARAAAYNVPAKKAAPGSRVLIGNIGTYSGVGGILNQGTQATLRVWTAWVNEHGGLNGHPVQMQSYDDQGDPSTAVSFAKQLDSAGAIAFLWNYSLFTSQSLVPAIEKLKIPWIGGDDFDPAMYSTPYMFPNNTPVRYQDATEAEYATSLGKTTAAAWWCIEAYVCQRAQESDDKNGGMASGGSKVVMNVSVSLTQPSYLSQCSTAKSKGVQFIVAHLDGASFIRAKRDCAQIGYNPMICNVAGAITPQLLTTDLTKGPDSVCFGVSSFPWWASDTPMQKAFHDAVAQFAPGTPSTYGSSGVWAAGEILRSSSQSLSANPTRDELLAGLHTVKNETFGGLTYPLTYTANPSVQSPMPYFNCGYVAVVTKEGKWDFSPGKKLFCTPRVSDFGKV